MRRSASSAIRSSQLATVRTSARSTEQVGVNGVLREQHSSLVGHVQQQAPAVHLDQPHATPGLPVSQQQVEGARGLEGAAVQLAMGLRGSARLDG
jgi:hypothetical protein